MALQLTGRIRSGDDLLDGNLRDIEIVTLDGGRYLYAGTGQGGGLSVWHLQDTGGLARLTDSTYFSVTGMGIGSFDAVRVDGQVQLILSGTGAGKLIRYRLETDGDLARWGRIDLPGDTVQDHAALAAATLPDGTTVLYTADAQSGALTGWSSSGTGGLSGAIGGPATGFDPDGPVLMQAAETGGARFLLAADKGMQGVRSFRISDADGALSLADSCGSADGLGVALPTGLETVTAHGATWVVLAAAGSSTLSVMRLDSSGALTPTDHILDTRATRFGGVSALEVVEADGHVFVLAGGSDDGISLFALLPDGRLVHMQTLIQDTGQGLDNVTGITATRIGDAIQVFVSSQGDGGLSQFTLPLAGLGRVIAAGQTAPAGNAPLSGTDDGDLMLAGEGQGTLLGLAGDDILVSDAGGGILTGGEGADIFVLQPTENLLRITDFEPGTDQLDLTAFPMLRGIGQLTLTGTDTGLAIGYGATVIDIHSHDGKPLTAADLWPDGFATPDRISLPPAPEETLIRGTAGADVLRGGAGADRIRAGAGNDDVRAGGGADTLFGGAGHDRLHGGAGRDLLKGGGGNDVLNGGGGADTLLGGVGDDRLTGGAGHDLLRAGGGDDVLNGARGDDILQGGKGADRLMGKAGADVLRGGGGADRLFGNGGGDVLSGGLGRDELAGQRGRDTLTGGGGADLFVFAKRHGADRITDFTPGADRIRLDVEGLEFSGLLIRAEGADTRIETGHGTITLTGLAPDSLGADDFLFL